MSTLRSDDNTFDADKYDTVDTKTKSLINGYIKSIQKLFDIKISYYKIPFEINKICCLFYDYDPNNDKVKVLISSLDTPLPCKSLNDIQPSKSLSFINNDMYLNGSIANGTSRSASPCPASPRSLSPSDNKQDNNNNDNNNNNINDTNDMSDLYTWKKTFLFGLFDDEYENYGKLHNESAMLHVGAYYVLTDDKIIEGEIYLTNFLLYFIPKKMDDIPGGIKYVILHIANICRINQQQKNKSMIEIELITREYRNIKFQFEISNKLIHVDKILQMLRALTFPDKIEYLFAFEYTKKHPAILLMNEIINDNNNDEIWGWETYNIEKEFNRMGIYDYTVKNDKTYRITNVNNNYTICETYPELLVIPSDITDWELQKVASFRRIGRLPTLTWKFKNNNNIALFRCSQPKVGLTSNRSRADEHLLQSIAECVSNNSILYIMDARPKLNANLNRVKGAGFENINFYKNIKFEFLNIHNIHVMRKARKALSNLIHNTDNSSQRDKEFYQLLGSTEWLTHIREILKGTYTMISVLIRKKCSVLCHCSDGWDRTSQLCGLVQLCLDAYYRTMKGFCILIAKDWLSFGHQFNKRIGHKKDDNIEEFDRSPVFEQFIECVWQLIQQFPIYFEFNELFLLTLLDHLYSCKYGTFLCDSIKQRQKHKLQKKTLSLWTHLQNCTNAQEFVNPFYKPTNKYLYPKYSLKVLKFWKGHHLEFCPEHILKKKPMYFDYGNQQIIDAYIKIKKENQLLKKQLAEKVNNNNNNNNNNNDSV